MNIVKNCGRNPVAWLIALIVVAVGLYFGLSAREPKGYSVIYLATGELYVGKLTTFPRWKLTDGYIFQVARDPANPEQSTFQLSPLKDALWAPEYLSINEDTILFSGPLSEESNVMQTLRKASTENAPQN